MKETELLYFDNAPKLSCLATVLSVEGEGVVVLDKTVCHPQGGGQPYDTGYMLKNGTGAPSAGGRCDERFADDRSTDEGGSPFAGGSPPAGASVGGGSVSGSVRFNIREVRMDRDKGLVLHIGDFEGRGGAFRPGDSVEVVVDEDKRRLYSRLHSAGHLIDACVRSLGYDWVPSRGHHFPEGPFVEYTGETTGLDTVAIKNNLDLKAGELIAQDLPVTIKLNVSQEDAATLCGELDPMYRTAETLRLVDVGGFIGPCGGTHVHSLGEIKQMHVTKIKLNKSKGVIHVKYSVE
ncbi:putative alanyl-tRNA synthetase [Gregarina niphandrodes]|uniref:Alanyl-tRNA synthetase n=1 Tax=Gregarina niphandrodes TaxID=110365 RepID=A0A023B9D7_GRENI|nr:putative alanyl-tRNA synthetase [Gregarina niphandrodes]EZG72872.1 putative alanyl-tRNA synthetase [Gregarina niphandrodes]|eukprot:XP_011129731.1 putative alanyl-tRNA synthetase [Gregarina niphandrodes]